MAGSYGKTFKSPLYPAFTFSLDDFHSMAAADSLSSSGGRSRRPCAKRCRRTSRSRILSAIESGLANDKTPQRAVCLLCRRQTKRIALRGALVSPFRLDGMLEIVESSQRKSRPS
jgi:hypothetical protein